MLYYRLRTTTVGVHRDATRLVAITVPSGTILKVPDDPTNARGFVEVDCEGEWVQIFAVDLRDRGVLIKALNA
jgi:hypothetical protein